MLAVLPRGAGTRGHRFGIDVTSQGKNGAKGVEMGLEASCCPAQRLRARSPPGLGSRTRCLAALPGGTGSGNGPIRGPWAGGVARKLSGGSDTCQGPTAHGAAKPIRQVAAHGADHRAGEGAERGEGAAYGPLGADLA